MSKKQKKIIYNFLRFSVGLGIIIFLYFKFKPADVSSLIEGRNFFWIIDAGLIYLLAIIVASVRLKIMLAGNSIHLNFFKIFWANISGMLFAEATPGKIGYLYTAHSISRKSGVKFSRPLSVLISTQVIDFVLRALAGVFAVVFILVRYSLGSTLNRIFILALAAAIIMSGILLLIVYSKKIFKIGERLSFKKKSWIFQGLKALQAGHKKSLKKISLVIFLSFFSWILTAARWIFLAHFFNLNLSAILLILLQPLVFTLSFVPISLGGLGITEGATVGVLILLGVSWPEALGFALFDRLSIYGGEILGLREFIVQRDK